MNRKEYIQRTLQLGLCSCARLFPTVSQATPVSVATEDEATKYLRMERDFLQNWLADFMEAVDKEVDQETRVKLYEGPAADVLTATSLKKTSPKRARATSTN